MQQSLFQREHESKLQPKMYTMSDMNTPAKRTAMRAALSTYEIVEDVLSRMLFIDFLCGE